jgi:hypothetical protein
MDNILGISPEELLRSKELAGGLEYDPIVPSPQKEEIPSGISTEVKEEIQEPILPVEKKEEPQPDIQIPKREEYVTPPSQEVKKDAVFEVHWKNLPIHLLPSKGLFYPE